MSYNGNTTQFLRNLFTLNNNVIIDDNIISKYNLYFVEYWYRQEEEYKSQIL